MKFKLKENKVVEKDNFHNASVVKEYRKLAGIKEGEKINKENIDDWALKVTASRTGESEEDIKKMITESLLTEVTISQAAKDLGAETVVGEDNTKTQIENELDFSLNIAKNMPQNSDFPNVLFVGEAGTGKSAVIRKWARDNNINLYEVRAAGMDSTDLGGVISPDADYKDVYKRLASTEFDKLNRPRSVLFLDEYNRAPREVRTNLLELVNSHVVPDPREEGGQRFLPNFLFTIGAINPRSSSYDTQPMDLAERSRFRRVHVTYNKKDFLAHVNRVFTEWENSTDDEKLKKIYRGCINLANTLFAPNSKLTFDTAEEIDAGEDKYGEDYVPLNYRSFFGLLKASGGTKEGLLSRWNQFVNPGKKSVAETELENYKDVDDKANSVFNQESESDVFKKNESDGAKILAQLKKKGLI